MKIIVDEHDVQWEVYTLKWWSFAFLSPLFWDLAQALFAASQIPLYQLPNGVVLAGFVLFVAVNGDYIYAARVKATPFYSPGKTLTMKKTKLQIWIKANSVLNKSTSRHDQNGL